MPNNNQSGFGEMNSWGPLCPEKQIQSCSTHRDPPASRCEKELALWGDPMASLQPEAAAPLEVQLLPPVPGLSLAKAPVSLSCPRTLGLGVLDWVGGTAPARPAGEGSRMRIREADPG